MSDGESLGSEEGDFSEEEGWLRLIARAPPVPIPSALEQHWQPPPCIAEFRIERLLGTGASAQVWLAHDTLLDRPVALKISTHEASDEARARFRMEALAVARLQHPNVLTVHQFGDLAGRPYLVTEVLSGQSVAELDSPMEPPAAVALALDLARGLAAAHRAGVLHRDVKPANAFFCDDGTAKLLDFGLAALHRTSIDPDGDVASTVGTTRSTPDASGADIPGERSEKWILRVAGTPRYMAPEAWRGELPTTRTDIYSLGALLFELLAGRPSCGATSIRELRVQVLAGDLESLATLAPAVPAPLVELVLRCLRLQPDERPSAEQLCDALVLAMPSATEDAAADDPEVNPYRGLLPFGQESRAWFFGREAETAAVLGELRIHPLVLVVGGSGIGKSSLVLAGVAPRAQWACGRRPVVMVPGPRPLQGLARAVASVLRRDEVEIMTGITGSPGWLGRELRAVQVRVLLVVDQLEELWTLASSRERSGFAEVLVALVEAGPMVHVVATLRSDFLDRLEDLGALRALALRAPIVPGPLSPAGLRRAIVEPARRRGVTVEPALVERLVAGAHATTLPLLEFALAELWERRELAAATLGIEALDALGGVEGALAAHADSTLAGMPSAERREARRVLLALVTVERTRVRREQDELLGESREARRALDAIVQARLVVAGVGERGACYEIAHEALLSAWPALRGWLDEEAAVREERERIRRAAAEWERLGYGVEALFGERQLGRLEALAGETLDGASVVFVAASAAAVRRARIRRRALVLGLPLLVALAGAITWGVIAWRHRAAIAGVVAAARVIDADAEAIARDADELRARAFALFEKDDLGPAEALWKQMLAREDQADARRGDVSVALDRALSLDPQSAEARAVYADVIFARLVAAERLHKDALRSSLAARLALYDDGTRTARLHAPGRVRVDTEPSGARLTLARYREDATGHLVEADPAPLQPGASHELEPGSYVVHAARAGRYPTTYPFVVRRGEVRELRVVLPRTEDVPDGMLYVPAGRFLYGSGDDEATRAFFTHQPMHELELGAFLIARTEVTYDDYLVFLRALSASDREELRPGSLKFRPDARATIKIWDVELVEGERSCVPGRPCVDLGRLPVDGMSQQDGARYVAWLSSSRHLSGARLCTDREWERAARGADDRRFTRGSSEPGSDDACTFATYGDWKQGWPCDVATHPASRSPFGADDMTGSVWEWTASAIDIAQPDLIADRGASWGEEGLYVAIPNRGAVSRAARIRSQGLRVCADVR